MSEQAPHPRFGTDIDPENLADDLEAYVERLRNGGHRLQGVTVEHISNHDEYSKVEISIRSGAHSDIPLFDLPIYGRSEEQEEDDADA